MSREVPSGESGPMAPGAFTSPPAAAVEEGERAAQLSAARAVFQGDWDENGVVSAYIPREIAEAYLVNNGWTRGRIRRGTGGTFHWVAPDGEIVWETQEALQLAITAEVM